MVCLSDDFYENPPHEKWYQNENPYVESTFVFCYKHLQKFKLQLLFKPMACSHPNEMEGTLLYPVFS